MVGCNLCEESFDKVSNLKNHVVNHFKAEMLRDLPSSKPYNCPLCSNAPVRDKITLLRHYAFSHKKIFDYCNPEDLQGHRGGERMRAESSSSRRNSPMPAKKSLSSVKEEESFKAKRTRPSPMSAKKRFSAFSSSGEDENQGERSKKADKSKSKADNGKERKDSYRSSSSRRESPMPENKAVSVSKAEELPAAKKTRPGPKSAKKRNSAFSSSSENENKSEKSKKVEEGEEKAASGKENKDKTAPAQIKFTDSDSSDDAIVRKKANEAIKSFDELFGNGKSEDCEEVRKGKDTEDKKKKKNV